MCNREATAERTIRERDSNTTAGEDRTAAEVFSITEDVDPTVEEDLAAEDHLEDVSIREGHFRACVTFVISLAIERRIAHGLDR